MSERQHSLLNVMLVLYVISSVTVRGGKARETWRADVRGYSSTTLVPSSTSLPQQARVFRACLGPLGFWVLFLVFVLFLPKDGKQLFWWCCQLMKSWEDPSISQAIVINWEREGNFCVRHCGCVISFHPYNSPLAEAVPCAFPLGIHCSITYPQGPIARTCNSLP